MARNTRSKGKTVRRVVLIVIGAVMIALGLAALIDRELMVWTSGIGVLIYGLGALIHWEEKRRIGVTKGITLAGSIVAMSSGVAILLGGQLGIFAAGIIVFILAGWLIAGGILEIIGSVIYRRAMTSADLGVQAPGSIASFVLGIIMIVAGAFALIKPVLAMVTAGIVIAVALVVAGVRMIVSSIYVGSRLVRTGGQI